MPTQLRKLKITAVALCKQGANPDAHIMLYKSMDSEGGNKMDFKTLMKSLSQDQQDVINAEIEKAKINAKPDPEDSQELMPDDKKMPDGKNFPDDAKGAKGNKAARALVKSLTEEVKTLTAEVNKSVKKSDNTEEEMFKSLPEPMQKYITDLKAQNAQALEISKALNEEKITKQFEDKAAIYKSLPADVKTLGGVLKTLSGVNKDACETLEGILKASDALIEKSALLKSLGDTGSDATSKEAYNELMSKAKEYVSKSTDITAEQAFAKACLDNPEIYKKYVEELNKEG